MEGRVIGINSRIAGALAANMHVPVGTFKQTWERLTKGEAWGHYPGQGPVLGVRGEEEGTTAKIARVVPESPAAKGGLQVGDVVQKFGGHDITDFKSLVDAVSLHNPGDPVKVVVKRGESTVEMEVKLGKRND
jgi:serine protease Do